MLIQEMDLRLDLGFVYAIADLVTKAEVTETTEVRLRVTAFGRIGYEKRKSKKILPDFVDKVVVITWSNSRVSHAIFTVLILYKCQCAFCL